MNTKEFIKAYGKEPTKRELCQVSKYSPRERLTPSNKEAKNLRKKFKSPMRWNA